MKWNRRSEPAALLRPSNSLSFGSIPARWRRLRGRWMMQHNMQLMLLALAAVLYAAAFVLGWRRMKRVPVEGEEASMGSASRIAVAVGTVICIALLVWRGIAEGKMTLAVSNHFDAFIFLALLLA